MDCTSWAEDPNGQTKDKNEEVPCSKGEKNSLIVNANISVPDQDPRMKATFYINGCSSVVVNDTLALTAAHCLDNNVYEAYLIPQSGQAQKFEVIDQRKHPQYYTVGVHDIGWVKFAKKLPNGVPRIPVQNLLSELQGQKNKVTLVGYGVTSLQQQGAQGQRPEKHSALVNFAKYIAGNSAQTIFNSILVSSDEGAGACYGDSGGPAYYGENSELSLLGVTSGVRGDIIPEANTQGCYSAKSIYTAVWPYKGWIESSSKTLLKTYEKPQVEEKPVETKNQSEEVCPT